MNLFFLAAAFALGACLGSFANVCVWRLPRPGLSPAAPVRSLCPRCGFRLPWFDNIPCVSWFLLRGACRRCGGTISVRYTLVEVLTGVAVALLAARFLRIGAEEAAPAPGMFLYWTVLAWGLIVAAFIDLELMILPDEIMIPALAVVPWAALYVPHGVGAGEDHLGHVLAARLHEALGSGLGVGPRGAALAAGIGGAAAAVVFGRIAQRRAEVQDPRPGPVCVLPFLALGAAYGALTGGLIASPATLAGFPGPAFFAALAGAAFGAALIMVLRVLGRYAFAQEAMGFGDVKLMALLGAMTGVGGALWTLAIASLLGAAAGVARYAATGDRHLPFGPFLIGGALVTVFARAHLAGFLSWYAGWLAGGA